MRTWMLTGLFAAALAAPGALGDSGTPSSPAQPQPVVVKVDPGFDWVDAGLGAAAAFAAVLVIAGLTLVVRTGGFHFERSER